MSTIARTSPPASEFVVSASAGSPVTLTRDRLDLLAAAAENGQRVVLESAASDSVSFAMVQLLGHYGGVRVVRAGDQLRSASSGRVLADYADAFTPESAVFDPADTGSVTCLQFTISTHHVARAEAKLGGVIEQLADLIADAHPSGWSDCEPQDRPWDRLALTRFARERMPDDSRLFVRGGERVPYAANLHVFRGANGVVEETKAVFAVADSIIDVSSVVSSALEELAIKNHLLFGMAWQQVSNPDATFAPFQSPEVQPVGSVLGARALRDLAIPLESFDSWAGARRVGTGRVPSIVVSFGDGSAERWARLAEGLRNPEIMKAQTQIGSPR